MKIHFHTRKPNAKVGFQYNGCNAFRFVFIRSSSITSMVMLNSFCFNKKVLEDT